MHKIKKKSSPPLKKKVCSCMIGDIFNCVFTIIGSFSNATSFLQHHWEHVLFCSVSMLCTVGLELLLITLVKKSEIKWKNAKNWCSNFNYLFCSISTLDFNSVSPYFYLVFTCGDHNHNFLWGGIPPASLSVTQTSIDFTSTNSLRGGILGFFPNSCFSVAPSEQTMVFSLFFFST